MGVIRNSCKHKEQYYPELNVLQKAWLDILQTGINKKSRKSPEWDTIRSLGEHPSYFYNPFIYRLKNNDKYDVFFVLLDDEKSFPWLEINFIINHGAILNGFLPLHSSAVIHNSGLYIFSGPSGAGKSTAAFLSTGLGAQLLDEDQIIIRENEHGEFFADAWGYSLQTCSAPIRGVFKINQSKTDAVQYLSAMKAAKFLFLRVLEVCGKNPPQLVVDNIFKFVSRMTQSIPGYELHFRKSPDFWKLIDAEIPVD